MGVNACVWKPVDCPQLAEVINQVGMFWMTINDPTPSIADIMLS